MAKISADEYFLCVGYIIMLCMICLYSDEEDEEEAKDFKGAVIKFHKLFKLPQEEKLVNCESLKFKVFCLCVMI